MIVNKIKKSNQGAVALLLVIMITALTVVSAVVVSMTNISDLMSSYFFGEAEGVDVELDACLDDAMFRLASSTTASGTYYLSGVGINCYYEIGTVITNGLKTVTSTASSTTSNIGYWQDTIVVQVNVSSTPITIDSYKNSNISFASFEYCGDSSCNSDETCSDCSADCGVCQVCGNGTIESPEVCDDSNEITEYCGDEDTTVGGCNADCSASLGLNEVCDDGGIVESCGDGEVQDGLYCNSSCSGFDTLDEACDYTGIDFGDDCWTEPVGCKGGYCGFSCSSCTPFCI